MLQYIFFISIFLVLYSYVMYPLVLLLLNLFLRKMVVRIDDSMEENFSISLIITAYNERLRIKSKLENSLQLKYPKELLEIIVASDCSDDGTDDLVSGYQDRGIKLVRANDHLGKEYAQKCAIDIANGSILVFSDVATEIPDDALLQLTKYYKDTKIGAVSSEDRFINELGKLVGEGVYVRYEMWLRQLESVLDGLVGLSGSFFSCRREVSDLWDIYSPSDFNTAINCARLNLKAISAKNVLGYYKDLSDPAKEYKRKVRTVIRGMTGLGRHMEVMNPYYFGLFAFQLFSHKLMRWLTPVFLSSTLVFNLFILDVHVAYLIIFILQLLFYATGILAHFIVEIRKYTLVRLIYFFLQVNVAIAHAGILYLSGQRMAIWQPSQR